MTPDEFYSIYGKALAGEEKFADVDARYQKQQGSSHGAQASQQVKNQKARQIVQPAQSQADTFDDAAIASIDPNARPPQQTAPPKTAPYQDQGPMPPRKPLYTELGGAQGIQDKAYNAGAAAMPLIGRGLEAGSELAGQAASLPFKAALGPIGFQGVRDMVSSRSPDLGPLIDEAKFQAKPILDDAEAARQRVIAMLRGGK